MTAQTRLDRRTVLAATAGALGAAASPASAGGGSPRWLLVPDVEFFERGLVGQYVVVTDPTAKNVDSSVMEDCGFADWSASETRGYRGLLLDRLSEEPHATQVPVYVNAARADVVPGLPYVITETRDCGLWMAVRVEGIEVETFGEERLPPNATVGNRAPAGGVEAEAGFGNATGGNATRDGGSGTAGRDGAGATASIAGATAAAVGWLRRD